MSFPPPRPSSTHSSNDSPSNSNNNTNRVGSSAHHSLTNNHPTQSSSSQQNPGPGQSPLDWANYINFPTPPVQQAGPAGNELRGQTHQTGSMQHGMTHQDQRQDGGQQQVGGEDTYQSFAQGIAMSRPSPSSINFRHPFPHRQSSSSQQPQQSHQPSAYNSGPSPHQHHMQVNSNSQAGPSRSPTGNGKGKSPVRPSSQSGPTQQQQDQASQDTGLSLDPDAFSRDIRFQVPTFLSNQVGGAPTFPPGGEAWSGFGASMFSNDSGGTQQLTPGSLFNHAFGLTGDNGGYNGNEQSGGGRNVLDGLSGFLGDGGAWDGWDKDTGSTGLTPGNNNNSNNNIPTTFYVNPNPSTNVLATQRHSQQPPQQQHHQQQSMSQQQNQHPSMQHRSSSSQSSVQSRQSGSNLQINTAPNHNISGSPRTANGTHLPSPRNSSMPQSNHATGNMPSHPTTSSMPTSAIFPQQASQAQYGQPATSGFYAPSLSTPINKPLSASTINIASSSTQPYAPPPNTQALLSGPALPPGMGGPSLTDGPGLYSTTGFDMVGVLGRVAARKDPKTVLGPVDLSCSFLVVDIRRFDCPIVYASPTFTALTGYDLPQILGRNCRFLQSPDGEVVKGSKRKYTDNVAVAHLKRMLNAGKECQASLINYRRGGIPFINLITVVPIPWDGTDIVYHVGFQVDLVEQPNAILRNMRDGSYQVNYTVANPPPPVLRPPGREGGLGLSQEIIEIMGPRINMPGFGLGEEGGKMEWLKMALENADDFVHVLSLKGLFQYVSPSVRRVLEYEPEDLLNKNISDICHPSDIVPLMRELKDSTHAPADGNSARRVHLVFRIRRKSSGYVWIECTGRLHVEPGKGRKAVILSGRALSVPTLSWDHVSRNGGLGETEGWMKVSFDGLILHATSTISDVVGINVDKLVGQSVFSLFPGESAALSNGHSTSSSHFALGLRNAANGDTRSAVVIRHYVMKRGTLVEVISIIYPPKTAGPRSGTIDSDDSSVDSDMSDPTSSSSTSSSGVRPSSLIIQMRAASPPPSRAIVHSATANVFEELETTRGTSWQYELHQLRLLNRRLKEDIAVAKSKGKTAKSKKRKDIAGDGNMGPPPNPTFPEHYSAAPRHQLAPGFGLVAPGLSPFYS